jgi:hypothetical protein
MSVLRTDEIERSILNYIIEKRGRATKNNVVHYMTEQGQLSRVPTLNKIDELKTSGKIIVRTGRGNRKGQAHFLAINNINTYNQINSWLTEINDILDEIETPLEYVYYYICGPAPDDPHSRPDLDGTRSKFLVELHQACHGPIAMLLDFLFLLTNRVIESEKDSQLLNQRIVDLHLKSMKVFSFRNNLTDIDANLKQEISTLGRCLDNPHLHELTDGTEINLNFGYNLRHKIEKFRKQHIENFMI